MISGAIGIIGYQIAFSGGGNSLGPTIVALTIPAAIAVVFVLVRSSMRGDINVKRVLKERTRNFYYQSIKLLEVYKCKVYLKTVEGSSKFLQSPNLRKKCKRIREERGQNFESSQKGDLRRGVGGNVDGVHLALDAAFGAFSMLGVAWIASVAI